MSAAEARNGATKRRGFTLLEVIGAIGIVAVVYVTLAQGAMQGLMWEGDARRRLEASLLADSQLADLEAGWISGAMLPDVGSEETEVDDYTVRVSVETVDAAVLLAGAKVEDVVSRLGARVDPSADALAAINALIDGAHPLRSVVVEVLWFDAFDERRIVRRTWALDIEPLRPQLEAAGLATASAGGNDETDATDPSAR